MSHLKELQAINYHLNRFCQFVIETKSSPIIIISISLPGEYLSQIRMFILINKNSVC